MNLLNSNEFVEFKMNKKYSSCETTNHINACIQLFSFYYKYLCDSLTSPSLTRPFCTVSIVLCDVWEGKLISTETSNCPSHKLLGNSNHCEMWIQLSSINIKFFFCHLIIDCYDSVFIRIKSSPQPSQFILQNKESGQTVCLFHLKKM